KMSFTNIGAAVAPIITDLSNKIAVIVGRISNWIKENRGLVRMVLIVAASLVAAGGAFVAFGYAMIFVSKAIAVIRTGFSVIKTALMFLMSPIGMIITSVTALTGIFLYFTGYGSQLLNWFGSCFNTLKQDATGLIITAGSQYFVQIGNIKFPQQLQSAQVLKGVRHGDLMGMLAPASPFRRSKNRFV
ncbi:MAG: hypothetical protein ABFD79_18230, partial [Phycisphaerales bacterium]